MAVEVSIYTEERPSVTTPSRDVIPVPQTELKIALTNRGHYCGFYDSKKQAMEYAKRCGAVCDALCKKGEHRIIRDVDTGNDCSVVLLDPQITNQMPTSTMPFYSYDANNEWILDDDIKIIVSY